MEETESAFLSAHPVTGSRMDHDIEIDIDDIFFENPELLSVKIGRKGQNFGFSLVPLVFQDWVKTQ